VKTIPAAFIDVAQSCERFCRLIR